MGLMARYQATSSEGVSTVIEGPSWLDDLVPRTAEGVTITYHYPAPREDYTATYRRLPERPC